MNNSAEEILRNYRTPGHPVAFSSPGRVARHFGISKNEAKNILSRSDAYTLHREYKRPAVYNAYFVYQRRGHAQSDLIDIRNLSSQNDQVSYLLLFIMVWSRKIWVYPLASKHGKVVAEKTREWLMACDGVPSVLTVDRGLEFWNQHVRAVLNEFNVDLQPADFTNKAAIAERVNKSYQILLYKFLTDRETLRYVDQLDGFTRTYNDRAHRTLQNMTPNQADLPENEVQVRGIHVARYAKVRRKKPTFKIGDMVRIKTETDRVSSSRRAYAEQFQGEYYRVMRVNRKLPIPMYYIMSLDTNEHIKGGFYSNHLVKIDVGDGVYKIDKILERRGRGRNQRALVRWKYFGPTHDSWINLTQDLVEHYN